MSFLDRALRKSEEALVSNLLGAFTAIGNGIDIAESEIACDENTNFNHLGLGFGTWSKTYVHRCRNVWKVSDNQYGLAYAHMHAWKRMDFHGVAIALIGLLPIASDTALQPPLPAKEPQGERETDQSSASAETNLLQTAMGKQIMGSFLPSLIEGGLSSETISKLFEPEVSSVILNWAMRMGGKGDEETELGTKWLLGTAPNSSAGREFVGLIEERCGRLLEMGLTRNEIADYWNEPFLQRASVYLVSHKTVLVLAGWAAQQCEESGDQNVTEFTAQALRQHALIFSRETDEVPLEESSQLPPEAALISIQVLNTLKEQLGQEQFDLATGALGANGVVRMMLKKRP
jgi:hypothetical protein